MKKENHLPTLDGWRAIAILLVVVNHAFGPPLGGYGVALFFALSGFLITSRLLDEREESGRISIRGFYVRRAFRILPAAFVYLAVVSLLGALTRLPVSPLEVLSSVFFFRNYVPLFLPHDAGMFTSQFWSLAVEEHFYLIWPLLFVFLLRRNKVLPGALLLALAIAVWRRGEGHFQFVRALIGLQTYQFNFRTDTRLDAILWGCILAYALRDPALRARIAGWLNIKVWAVIAVAYVVLMMVRPDGIVWMTLLSPLVIVGTLLNPDSAASRLLENGVSRWIARISYSLYLWHPLFMPQYAGARVWPGVQAVPQSIVLAFLFAMLSYYLVERPINRFGHKLSAKVG